MPVLIPPAGLSPAGLFVAQTFVDPSQPPGILADAIDPTTGEYLSITRGMDPVDAQVLLALTRKRRSGASVMQDGQDFTDIRKIDESTPQLIESKARTSLGRLTAKQDISIEALEPFADPASQSGSVAFRYRNLRARGAQSRKLTVLP